MNLKGVIRTVPHWPKQGIMFRDVTTLLLNPEAFRYTIEELKKEYAHKGITKIAGIESRGFVFGAALAHEMKLPLVLIRKKGKLPADVVSMEYALEYGTDKIEVHRDAIEKGDKVLIVDDLIATAGTMKAACQLIEKLEGIVVSCAFVVELPELGGRKKLAGYNVFSLVHFEGE